MNTLVSAQAAYLNALSTALPNHTVRSHGGEFDLKQIETYGARAPALVLTLLRFDVFRSGGYPTARAHWGLVCITKNEGDGFLRHTTCVQLAEQAAGIILPLFAGANLSGATSSAQKQIISRNLFSSALDLRGVAMWGLEWTQLMDLVQDHSDAVDFKTLKMFWDLAPDTDGVYEAEDEITNLDLVDDDPDDPITP